MFLWLALIDGREVPAAAHLFRCAGSHTRCTILRVEGLNRMGSQPHPDYAPRPEPLPQTPEELQDEQRRLRRLQIMVNMVMSVIGQDPSLTVDEASEMVADTRRAALAMFPGKELAFDLIYRPRLQRLMRERFRIH